MTGLDCLREEMKKRGCNEAQITSKTAAVVLDILANTGHVYSDIVEAETKLKIIKAEAENIKWNLAQYEARERERIKRIEERWQSSGYQEYITKFIDALNDCETKEARDRLCAAQLFVNSVEIASKYDNTAYINWLGAILAGASVPAGLAPLRKINPKLFTGLIPEENWEV